MLKIWRNEYKSFIIAPVVAILLCTVLALVGCIKVATTAVADAYSSPTDMFDSITFIFIVITVSVPIAKSWRKDDIYKLMGVKEYKLILSRAALLFIIVCVWTLIIIAEFSITRKIYYNKFGMDDMGIYEVYSMVGKSAKSWSLIPAVAMFAIVVYFSGLAVTPVVRHAQRMKTVRYFVALAAFAGLMCGFYALAPLSRNIAPSLNFNKPITVMRGVFSQTIYLLPLNMWYFFGSAGVVNGSMVTVNVLSLTELLFCFVYCAFCYGLYLVGYRRSNQKDWKKYKKAQAALIATLSALAVCAVTVMGVLITKPEIPYINYQGTTDLEDGANVDLSAYHINKYMSDYHYDVDFEFCDPDGQFAYDENGNPVQYYGDGRTITFLNNYNEAVFDGDGRYVIHITLTQKFTMEKVTLISERFIVGEE